MGDALVAAALGRQAPDGRDVWAVRAEDFRADVGVDDGGDAATELPLLLDRLLDEYVARPQPNVKQVAASFVFLIINCLLIFHQIKQKQQMWATSNMIRQSKFVVALIVLSITCTAEFK